MVKSIIKKIIELWNIYGGIFLSGLTAWVFGFNDKKMDETTSFLLMTLTFVSILTFFKKSIFGKKTNIVENALLNNQSFKVADTIIDEEKKNQELEQVFIKTKKILERIFEIMKKFLLTYKGVIITTLISIFNVTEWIVDFIPAILVIKGVDILNLVLVALAIVLGCISWGYGTPETKEKFLQLKDVLDGDKTNEINRIKDIKYLEKMIKSYQHRITKLEQQYKVIIENFERNQRLGLVDNETAEEYNKYSKEVSKLNSIIEIYIGRIEDLNK